MYPLGVLFGLGFDTSSEIALLGIASIQAAKGTSIWLILIFPVLFTAGMCLIDTIDGALMLTIYIIPAETYFEGESVQRLMEREDPEEPNSSTVAVAERSSRSRDPVAFLYYSIVLTALTIVVALVIGTIQLLTMILNVAEPTGSFWNGVDIAGNNYEIIGGGICGSFVVVGGLSILFYKPWRRWAERQRPPFIESAVEDDRSQGRRIDNDDSIQADNDDLSRDNKSKIQTEMIREEALDTFEGRPSRA